MPGKEAVVTAQFNAPPGWPSPPPGWQVPPGWRPDPSWPAPPQGWPFWVEDRPQARGTVAASVAMAGGVAVLVGSFLPWVSFDSAGLSIKPAARIASAVVGAILVGLALRVRTSTRPRSAAGIIAVILSGLACLAYNGFILIGEHGIPTQDDLGDSANLAFHPNIGIIVMAVGSLVIFVATITAMKARRA
jgi:hypothetical protein